ncbi:MAG: hypothetical protein ACJ8F7_23290 [Gemmataceae bacterium]
MDTPDRDELLMWRILGKLEALALRKYEAALPHLAIPEKKALVVQLLQRAPDDAELAASPLGQPIQDLLQAADREDQTAILIVQGMVLERLGQIIYKALSAQQTVSQATRSLASSGWSACSAVIEMATQQIRQQIGEGERLFDVFCSAADGVLKRLDGLGDGVDRLFGQRFGLTFSEVLGDFTAELLPACVALGISRRKLVCHLAGVFMGL